MTIRPRSRERGRELKAARAATDEAVLQGGRVLLSAEGAASTPNAAASSVLQGGRVLLSAEGATVDVAIDSILVLQGGRVLLSAEGRLIGPAYGAMPRMLQGGRVLLSAEGFRALGYPGRGSLASMRPRSSERGRPLLAARLPGSQLLRFNEAAFFGARKGPDLAQDRGRVGGFNEAAFFGARKE